MMKLTHTTSRFHNRHTSMEPRPRLPQISFKNQGYLNKQNYQLLQGRLYQQQQEARKTAQT